MPVFQISGLASGLDTNSIVDQLMAIERRPLVLLQQREAQLNERISLYQDLNSRLSTFRTKVKELGDASTLQNITATSSNEDALGVSATSSANIGTFPIKITQLAKQSVLMSTTTNVTITDADATLQSQDASMTSGTIRFTINGTSTDITYDVTTDSLNDIRDAINNAGIDATASVVDVSGNGTDYRLVVTGTKTGLANAVDIDMVSGNLKDRLDLPSDDGTGRTPEQQASDAIIELAGVQISRDTNTITDVLTGVTLTLKQTTTSDVNVEVKSDTSANVDKIQEFVDALNDYRQFVIDQTTFSEEASSQAPLFGDPMLISLDTEIRSLLSQSVGSGSITRLVQMGITFDTDTGLYTLDRTTAEEQLNDDAVAVQNFFEALKDSLTTVDNKGRLDRITDSIDGTIKTKTDFLQSEIDLLKDSQERMEARLERRREMLERQFRRLEQVMSEMQTISSMFSAQLSQLNALAGRTAAASSTSSS